MKKLFSIILLSIILLKIGGFVAILIIEREVVREQMIQKISQNIISQELTYIVGSEQNLAKIEWERDDKEFWFDGKLYDVVKTETKNGLVNYYCIADEEEQNLFADIRFFAQGQSANSPLNEASKDILLLIFQQIILPTHALPCFDNIVLSLSASKFPPLLSLYLSSYCSRILAPPQSNLHTVGNLSSNISH